MSNSEKSLEQIACELLWKNRPSVWSDSSEQTKKEWKGIIDTVIAEYHHRNSGAPVGYVNKESLKEISDSPAHSIGLIKNKDKFRNFPLYAAPNPSEDVKGLLLWVLYNHQGGSSPIGQPIRKMLGIGQFEDLTDEQIKDAKKYDPSQTTSA